MSLANLADVYQLQERYGEAEPLIKRSLGIYEKVEGPDHHYVGIVLHTLATLYRAQGRYLDAEPLYKRSLAIREKALGPDHPDVGASLNNLAQLYQSQGHYAEAEQLYKRGLAITEKAVGADQPRTSRIAGNLGSFLKSEGRLDEAEPLLKHALDAGEKSLDTMHPQVIRATVQLADSMACRAAWRKPGAVRQGRAAKSVDLRHSPFLATNRKRNPNRNRIAFGGERNLGELALRCRQGRRPTAGTAIDWWAQQHQRRSARAARQRPAAWWSQPADLSSAVHSSVPRASGPSRRAPITARRWCSCTVTTPPSTTPSAAPGSSPTTLISTARCSSSAGPRESLLSYVGARESAQLSGEALREFIDTVVAETKAKRIHIIAHSMGNVALNDALWALDQVTLAKLNIGEMVLASPDLDPDLFQRTYKRPQKRGARGTICAASSDWARVALQRHARPASARLFRRAARSGWSRAPI